MIIKKPFTSAAYGGVGLIILVILNVIISSILVSTQAPLQSQAIVKMIFSLLFAVCFVSFSYGFVVLGKKFNAQLLSIMAWIGFIMTLLFVVVSLISSFASVVNPELLITGNAINSSGNYTYGDFEGGDFNPDNFPEFFAATAAIIILLIFLILIPFIVYSILFGVGILKLEDKVPHARAVGMLNIIGGATIILLGFGFLLLFVSFFFEIAMFFNLAKYEGSRGEMKPRRRVRKRR